MEKTQGIKDQPIEWQIEFYSKLKNSMEWILSGRQGDLSVKDRATAMLTVCSDELTKLKEVKL